MKKCRILIIEDEIFILKLLARMLKSLGYETDEADTLRKGFNKFESMDPDVVFLDLNLPDGSGFSAISDFKKYPEIKVIVVSAYDGYKERDRAKSLGADYFIGKPFDRKEIEKSLEIVNCG